MSDEEQDGEEPEPKKKKSKGLIIALVLALVLGGGGFYAVYSGLIPLGGSEKMADADAEEDKPKITYDHPAYVALEPFIISLGERANARHLKVTISVEVEPGTEAEVAAAMPRINDVLNTYLRAVDEKDLEVPRAMMRLRAHMLRRVQLVSPPDAVRDVLFQEFILN